jgi:hypothetical protein
MADPGPQSSSAFAVSVPAGEAEPDVAVVPVGDAESVGDAEPDVAGGVVVPCDVEHDVTVVNASKSTKVEPITVGRL